MDFGAGVFSTSAPNQTHTSKTRSCIVERQSQSVSASMIQHLLGLVHLSLRFPQPKSTKNKVNQKSATYALAAMVAVGNGSCWKIFKAHLRRAATIFAPQQGGKILAARDLCGDREGAWRWQKLKDFLLDFRIFWRNMATDKENKVDSCLPFSKACISLNIKKVVLTCD